MFQVKLTVHNRVNDAKWLSGRLGHDTGAHFPTLEKLFSEKENTLG
jgi:hypothetical protein